MVPGEVAQIKIGDYVIPKKDNAFTFCFEVAFTEWDDYGPDIALFDMKEMLQFEGSLIKKNSKKAKNLEMLYGKV